MQLFESAPLAPRTTFGLGGPAAWLCEADGEDDVLRALEFAAERQLQVHVLGGGSNLVVADRGVAGLVLRVRHRAIDALPAGERVRVTVAAGTPWDELVAWSVERGYAGLECLSGIPGDVGAAPIQNVGAYGQEVGDCVVRVRALDRTTGAAVEFARAACGFGYRESIFKGVHDGRFVVVAVELELAKGPPTLAYAELARAVAEIAEPSLAEVRRTVLALRRGKSMLFDPTDENCRSVGSFFVNPTVSPEVADAVEARARSAGVPRPLPRFPHGSAVKLAAAWLIEHAGMPKGTRRGSVGLSTRHSLAIVAQDGATAADVIAFGAEIRRRVYEAFGVTLHPEARPLGFAPGELDALYGPLEGG